MEAADAHRFHFNEKNNHPDELQTKSNIFVNNPTERPLETPGRVVFIHLFLEVVSEVNSLQHSHSTHYQSEKCQSLKNNPERMKRN